MNSNADPHRKRDLEQGITSTGRTSSTGAPGPNKREKKSFHTGLDGILRSIPLVGEFLVSVRQEWGLTGILLLFGGFIIAAALVFFGYYPEKLVSPKFRTASENREYELKAQREVLLESAIQSARRRIWASGVALNRLDPQLIAERAKNGVSVQLVYLNPCGVTVKQRMPDEGNDNAVDNIQNNLKRLAGYRAKLSESQKELLSIRLTDIYPTMVVIIIDNDLFAYFCAHGSVCTSSPVLWFQDYDQKKPMNAQAKFFEDHFRAVRDNDKLTHKYEGPCSASKPALTEP